MLRRVIHHPLRCRLPLIFAALLLCGPVRVAWGQVPFLLQVQQGSNLTVVSNGATVSVAASGPSSSGSITILATYQGTSTAVVSSAVISGSSSFTVTTTGLPATLGPGNSVSIPVQYLASTGGAPTAQLTVNYKESSASTAGVITLNLIGTAASLQVSYALQTDQNVVPLASGGTLQFPPIQVNTNISATVTISNRGTGNGSVNSVAVSGTAFQVLSLPLLPATIASGSSVQFVIRYTATQIGTDTGTLTIDLGGSSFKANLAGSGISAQFSYELLTTPTPTPITPNQTITLPDTNVGILHSVTVQVQNTGSASGSISQIVVSGAGFSVTDTPTLPALLNPNDILTFTLNFQPTQPGVLAGRLRVGNDQFPLSGKGLGPKLIYSYVSGAATTVLPGGQVVFSPTQVGQTSQLPFTITNMGTTAATVSSISVADTHNIFALEKLPASPLTLNPGDSTGFTIDFSPAATGLATSMLQIDAQGFALTGPGTAPPPLPQVQFSGASGNVTPFSQLAMGVGLASPYSVPLNGILTMTFDNAQLAADAAAQFATGGRTVAFTIAPNSTQAVFSNGANQIGLQTGTTAGTITLTPTFTTAGGFAINPSSPAAVGLTVPTGAPRILSVQTGSVAGNSFVLTIKGFATTHSLTKLNFQFTAASDVKMAGGPISVDLSAASADWYRSSPSLSFGGQFSVTMPFTVQSSVTSPTSKIQAVSITAVNDQGTSAAFSSTIP